LTSQAALAFAERLSRIPELKEISDAGNDIARLPRNQCVTLGNSPELKTCAFGDLDSSTHVLLFGDSHAIQWFDVVPEFVDG
jgi:hypothetical protein